MTQNESKANISYANISYNTIVLLTAFVFPFLRLFLHVESSEILFSSRYIVPQEFVLAEWDKFGKIDAVSTTSKKMGTSLHDDIEHLQICACRFLDDAIHKKVFWQCHFTQNFRNKAYHVLNGFDTYIYITRNIEVSLLADACGECE